MPALPPVPNVLKVLLKWQVGPDGNAVTVLHFAYTGSPPSTTTLAGIGTAINSSFGTNLKAQLFSGNSYLGCVMTDLGSSSGAQLEVDLPTVGTLGGQTLPAQCCVLVNYHVANRYRGGKPRSYLPLGQGGNLTNDETWAASFVTAVQNAWTNFLAAFDTTAFGATTLAGQVVVSYYSGFTVVTSPTTGRARNVPKLRAVPLTYNIISFLVNTKPGTQKRRLQR